MSKLWVVEYKDDEGYWFPLSDCVYYNSPAAEKDAIGWRVNHSNREYRVAEYRRADGD